MAKLLFLLVFTASEAFLAIPVLTAKTRVLQQGFLLTVLNELTIAFIKDGVKRQQKKATRNTQGAERASLRAFRPLTEIFIAKNLAIRGVIT